MLYVHCLLPIFLTNLSGLMTIENQSAVFNDSTGKTKKPSNSLSGKQNKIIRWLVCLCIPFYFISFNCKSIEATPMFIKFNIMILNISNRIQQQLKFQKLKRQKSKHQSHQKTNSVNVRQVDQAHRVVVAHYFHQKSQDDDQV